MIVIKPTTSLLSSDKDELAKSIDLNIEQYDYVVESLPETKKIDLFSSDIVKFYGLITNEVVYVVNKDNTTISDELKDTLRLGKVKTVIYVNSSTSMLAKDLQELSKYYKVVEIKAVDSHVYQSYVTSIVKLIKK